MMEDWNFKNIYRRGVTQTFKKQYDTYLEYDTYLQYDTYWPRM